EKWLPMVTPFRLMLVFALIDPIRNATANLFVAVGEPQRVVWTRAVQLAVLVGGLFLFGSLWQINGAALAIDVMLLVGTALFLWQARLFVDFSFWRLFGPPALGVVVGLLLAWGGAALVGAAPVWLAALVKVAAYAAGYGLVLLRLERERLLAAAARVLVGRFGVERRPAGLAGGWGPCGSGWLRWSRWRAMRQDTGACSCFWSGRRCWRRRPACSSPCSAWSGCRRGWRAGRVGRCSVIFSNRATTPQESGYNCL